MTPESEVCEPWQDDAEALQSLDAIRRFSARTTEDGRDAHGNGSVQRPQAETRQAELRAYETQPQPEMPITPAPRERDWMDESDERHPYRCLPLLIANQAGWFIHNPVDFTAVWFGGKDKTDVQITFHSPFSNTRSPACVLHSAPSTIKMFNRPEFFSDEHRVTSHFGQGIVTFAIPYVFRTPSGVNLWVKGPSNLIKDGAHALEGIVETDWVASTFTMNWKLTRPNYAVRFLRGEPICMIVPVARHLAECLNPIQLPIETDRQLCQNYRQWDQSRTAFLKGLAQREPEPCRQKWQRHYFKGESLSGARAPEHQTRLRLKEFVRYEHRNDD